ncbi:MAG: hypothetical protein HY246_14290 [Proteobacteria bacterium]|nr:hypothetical protein [Pseudomonadota bacterium]
MRRMGPTAIIAFAFAGCATSQPMETTTTRLNAAIEQCAASNKYELSSSLGDEERRLAPNERPFRDCVYRGVEDHVIPLSAVPTLYRAIIVEDRAMTAQIDAGALTRGERRQRLEQLYQSIEQKEVEAQQEKTDRSRKEIVDMLDRQRQADDIVRASQTQLRSVLH